MGAYAFETSSICCGQCGEPAVVADGGQVACGKCGQAVQPRSRSSYLRVRDAPSLGTQPPAFRAQDGKPLLPPPNIAFLWENGTQIPPHRQAEALMAWQG